MLSKLTSPILAVFLFAQIVHAQTAPIAPARGVKKVAVVLVTTPEHPEFECQQDFVSELLTSTPESRREGHESAREIFERVSWGQLSLESDQNADGLPDIFGPYQLNMEPTTVDRLESLANQMAREEHHLDSYDHLLYVIPTSMPAQLFTSAAVAYFCSGHSPCISIYRDCAFESANIVHELGHNLGLGHAGYDSDGDGVVESAGPGALGEDYGDFSSPMGVGNSHTHFNAPDKVSLGWLAQFPSAFAEPVIDRSIELSPFAISPASAFHPQVLRLGNPKTGESIFISFREHFEQRTSEVSQQTGQALWVVPMNPLTDSFQNTLVQRRAAELFPLGEKHSPFQAQQLELRRAYEIAHRSQILVHRGTDEIGRPSQLLAGLSPGDTYQLEQLPVLVTVDSLAFGDNPLTSVASIKLIDSTSTSTSYKLMAPQAQRRIRRQAVRVTIPPSASFLRNSVVGSAKFRIRVRVGTQVFLVSTRRSSINILVGAARRPARVSYQLLHPRSSWSAVTALPR